MGMGFNTFGTLIYFSVSLESKDSNKKHIGNYNKRVKLLHYLVWLAINSQSMAMPVYQLTEKGSRYS